MSPTEKAVTEGISASIITLMLVSITLIVLAFIFLLFCFYVRAKLYRTARNAAPSARIRILMVPDHHSHTPLRRGLDPELLRSLPVTNNSGGLECAVCLTDITQGEDVRVLPACRHGFHLQCIDTWFRCNDTCPLCRSSVVAQPPEAHLVDVPSVPDHVPREGEGGFPDVDSPLPASRMPAALAYERLRSLGRRLSRGRREIGGGGGSVCNQLRTSSNLSA